MSAENYLDKMKNIKHEINAKAMLIESMGDILIRAKIQEDNELTKIQEDIKELFNEIKIAMNIINKIEDERFKAILIYIYIEGLTMFKCAEIMGYELSWAYRLKNKAIQSFENIYNTNKY